MKQTLGLVHLDNFPTHQQIIFYSQFILLIWRLKTCSKIIFRVGSDSHKHISSFVLHGIIKPKPGADLKYWTISVVIQNTKEEDV